MLKKYLASLTGYVPINFEMRWLKAQSNNYIYIYIYNGETRRHGISFGRLDAAWVITKIVGCNA
jgi:hypothetical protein